MGTGRSSDISSAYDWLAVTPGASPLPNGVCRALFVGVAGNITATSPKGNSVQFTNVPVGIFPVQCLAVTAATATGIVALY